MRLSCKRGEVGVGIFVSLTLALTALTGPGLAQAASLAVSVSPASPTYADNYTMTWSLDATSFPPNPVEHPPTHRFARVDLYLIHASGPGCAPAERDAVQQGVVNTPGFDPPTRFEWTSYPSNSFEEPVFQRADKRTDASALPAGDYILCGYMYDMANNFDAPTFFGPGGIPDVGPIAHPFTVRAANATVSLSTSSASIHSGENLTVTIPWSAEPIYNDSDNAFQSRRGAQLALMIYPDSGQSCPADLPSDFLESELEYVLGAGWGVAGKRSEIDPDRVDHDTMVRTGPINKPAGDYVVCSYIYRQDVHFDATFMATEAHSEPIPLHVDNPLPQQATETSRPSLSKDFRRAQSKKAKKNKVASAGKAGRRAAALQRCRKMKTGTPKKNRARHRCIQRAKKLPA